MENYSSNKIHRFLGMLQSSIDYVLKLEETIESQQEEIDKLTKRCKNLQEMNEEYRQVMLSPEERQAEEDEKRAYIDMLKSCSLDELHAMLNDSLDRSNEAELAQFDADLTAGL